MTISGFDSGFPNTGARHVFPKVLLVDDEPETLRLIRKILEADNYRVFEAGDGEQALELFEKITPDLVLLDVVMPKIDGMAALKAIRQRDKIAGVIMVSALTSEQLAVQAMLDGADDFVSKPFKLKSIRVRIRQVLDKSNLRRENARLQSELQVANEKLHLLFRSYMAGPVAERLLTNPVLPSLGGERQVITVLFMDFANFTVVAQHLEPDEVLHVLNERLALVTAAVLQAEGTLDKFMGDGVMAFFNAPIPQEDHVLRAAQSAIAMRDSVVEWNKSHNPTLNIRIGIHTGETVVGNIGTSEIMNYTAVGDTVNLAKRLQEHSEDNVITVSENVCRLLPVRSAGMTALGPLQIKGRQFPVDAYRLDYLVAPG